eukprot:TRINITY_DN120354_c1_g1_i1.p1 TRINITY_DN120354_c1_g1~~TRINITY_DN120354_c1_g1_i1.p1  ORF type:complete len:878 (+),score=144.26 TRINITY_DN120354_c1_g1_i1:1438-4071(+)
MDMDIAAHRPLLATCSKADSTLRIWNYVSHKCEMVKCLTSQHTSRPPEPVKPLSLAFHPSGYLLAGGFDSQTIIWHLLLDELRDFYIFPHYKHCTRLRFSNGGQYLAIAQMVQTQKCVYVHHTYTLKKICTIKVPSTAMVCDIVFNDDDSLISLCCSDGSLIVYNILDQSESTHSKQKCVYTTCRIRKQDDVIVFGADEGKRGVVRRIHKEDITESYDISETKIMYAQFLTSDCIIAGTDNGLIKYYEYPSTKPYGELNVHAGPISKILVSPNGQYVFSCGEDGVIFMYSVSLKMEKGHAEEVKGDEIISSTMLDGLSNVVLVEKEKIRAEQKNLEELNLKVNELQNDIKARVKQSKVQWAENVKELEAEKKKALAELEARLSSLKEELSKKEQQHTEAMKKLEASHVNAIADLEAIFKARIDRQKKSYMNLEQSKKEEVRFLNDKLERLKEEKDKELLEEQLRYEKDLERLNRKIKEVKDAQSKAERRFEDKLTLQEEEHGEEMNRREEDLNKEISALKSTIKSKDEAFNKLQSQYKELYEKNLQLDQDNKALREETKQLEGQKKAFQAEAEKARQEKQDTLNEMNELKGNVISLKSKNKEGMKDKQALADVAKSLREKMAPVIEENTNLKTKIKQIEEEYNVTLKIMEKMKDTIVNQDSIIRQLRETDKKRDLTVKKSEENVDRMAQKLYQFKEAQDFDRNAYAFLFKELYAEYVEGHEDKFQKNPEIVGELGRQIQHLQEKKTSLERNNKLKNEQLTKLCVSLRRENAKLIDDLNETRKRLQETLKQKMVEEAKPKASRLMSASGEQSQIDRKGFSMTMKVGHMLSAEGSGKVKSTDHRPFTTKQRELWDFQQANSEGWRKTNQGNAVCTVQAQ